MLRPTLLFLALTLAFAPCCLAQRPDVLPAAELTPAQREQLNRDKLIIGAKSYRQIFSLYLVLGKKPDAIRFITSDAALAAYHALFEDSFRELELRRAARLRGDLEKLYDACKSSIDEKKQPHPPPLIQYILGPALVILGTHATTDNFSENLLSEINRQVALIRAADKMECPPWLDYSKDDQYFKIDYRRCRPVSFYAENPALADYHRVIRWLQLVPLRATNDEELAAWARMVCVTAPWRADAQHDSFTGLSVFVGPIADRTISVSDSDTRTACSQLIHYGLDSEKSAQSTAPLLARLRKVLLANASKNPARSAINEKSALSPKKMRHPFPKFAFA